MKRRPQKERQGIQSVELGYRVLAVIADNRGPLSLRELSQRAAMPASKVHRYLVSFIRCGLAEQDPTTNRYDLGAGSLALGLAALNRQNAIRFTTAAAIELNQRFDVTVFVTVWGNRGPVVIGMYDSNGPVVSCLSPARRDPQIGGAGEQGYEESLFKAVYPSKQRY
jgi:DNA-binding IclR family transcriptional regulator